MRIADGIVALELTANTMGRTSLIHPTVIWDDEMAILVDTGFPGMLPQIREALAEIDVPIDRLRKIILTHQDIDHIGCLAELIHESGDKIEALADAIEKPYIEGEKVLIKMNPERMKQMFASLPDEQREQAEKVFKNPPRGPIHTTVQDEETLPWCGGITVISTPGHSPGHIALYHIPSKTLITGDSLVVVDGQLRGPNPQMTPDMDEALRSVKKFTEFDIQTVVCYHGGVFQDHPNDRLAEL